MVDLAKIRKKARKQSAERGAQRAEEPSPASPQAEIAPPTDNRQPTTASADPEPQAPSTQQPATSTKLERFKAEAGKRRETVKIAVTEQSAQVELLTFLIAGEQYAVEIERILEIVPPRPITRIPNADTSVVGIISLRGTIVTLVDVRRKLGHPPGAENADMRIVVIDFRSETIGFAVDRVLRVVKLGAAEIEPHPVVHATELEDSIRGVFRTAGALTILLDLDKLLDSRSTPGNQWT